MSATQETALETARLRLRMFRPADLDEFAAICADPDVMRWLATGETLAREQVERGIVRRRERFEENGYGLFAVERKEDGKLMGQCGLFPVPETGEVELAYMLARDCWGFGYATEACLAVLDFAFDTVGLERVVAFTYPENTASQHVLKKVGMKAAGETTYHDIITSYFTLDKADRPAK